MPKGMRATTRLAPKPVRISGLRRNTNERYYQFVIWSELMCSFPWLAETERDLSR